MRPPAQGVLVAVAALGLAFGAAAASEVRDSALANAHGPAMLAADSLAAISALTAALTISPRKIARAVPRKSRI
jgi:hypothetical protein